MNAGQTRARFSLSLLAALLTFAAPQAQAADQCRPSEAVTSFGTWFSPAVELTTTNWTQPVSSGVDDTKIESMRLLIGVTDGTDRVWNLVIRDQAYHVLATFGGKDFMDAQGGFGTRRWTGHLPSDRVRVDLLAAPSSDVKVMLLAGVALPAASSDQRLFSIKHDVPDWEPLYSGALTAPKRAGDAVGMLITGWENVQTNKKESWCCTGVMLSADTMLTNWHCGGTPGMSERAYWNSDICANTLVDLSWDDGKLSRQYSCESVLAKDSQLDIALFRLRPVVGAGGGIGEPVRARLATSPAADGTELFVVHHAQCNRKLVSARCAVTAAHGPASKGPERDFAHNCDTEPGASGAPVFNSSGQLVGLHHEGFARDAACQPTDRKNKAVRIDMIVSFIKKRVPQVAAELGLDQ